MAAKKARDVIRSKTAARRRGHARQAEGLHVEDRATSASCSSSRATPPAAPPSWAATRRTQAILPIRGKILNVERARLDKMLKNLEIQALISAIGAGVGRGVRRREESATTRSSPLCDADVDGSHIRTLLLTFFFRQMKHLVEHGHVYIAQPPLYSTEVGKEKMYLKDDVAKAAFLGREPQPPEGLPAPEGPRRDGLGRAAATRPWTADQRTLLQVTIEQAALADDVISTLMGDDVESRKQFIISNANDVRFLDI